MATPFFVSHHLPGEYHRCVKVLGFHLCTRCLAVYPAMFAVMAAEIGLRAPLGWVGDPLVAFALPVPALIDWARGRFSPRSGSNASRLVTGLLLGLSLGRTLYQHLLDPGHLATMAQLGGLALVFVAVEVTARLSAARADPKAGPDVPP